MYGHADPSLAGSTLNLGYVHQGYGSPVTSSNSLTATNSASGPNLSYIVNLNGSATSSGGVTVTSITGSGVAPGGSTSLSVLGAYVLAGELAQADGDYARAFASYEQQMAAPVRRSRAFARTAAKTIVPSSRAGVWVLTRGAQLVSMLPAGLTKAVAKLNPGGLRMYDSMQYKDYSTL